VTRAPAALSCVYIRPPPPGGLLDALTAGYRHSLVSPSWSNNLTINRSSCALPAVPTSSRPPEPALNLLPASRHPRAGSGRTPPHPREGTSQLVLSCLLHAASWANAPRWGEGRSSPTTPIHAPKSPGKPPCRTSQLTGRLSETLAPGMACVFPKTSWIVVFGWPALAPLAPGVACVYQLQKLQAAGLRLSLVPTLARSSYFKPVAVVLWTQSTQAFSKTCPVPKS
jgi:hypothetical protein